MKSSMRVLVPLAVLAGLAATGTGASGSPRGGPGVAGDVVVARTASGLAVVDGASGRTLRTLADGVASAGWHVVYSATAASGRTEVTATETTSGRVVRRQVLPGEWQLPQIAADGSRGVLASGGRYLALAATANDAAHSRFAVLSTGLAARPRYVSLDGQLALDGLAPNGTLLYLIHALGGGADHYEVRAANVVAGSLLPGAIVDKREIGEKMTGYPVTRLTDTGDGWLYTVYRRDGQRPFIHALNTRNRFAWCIDLPNDGAADAAAAATWSLALAHDTVYAANPALGVLARFGAYAAPPRTDVGRFKASREAHAALGGVAVSPDGKALYVAGGNALVKLAPDGNLRSAAPLVTSTLSGGVAVSRDGARLYSLAGARLVRIDAASGTARPLARLSSGGLQAVLGVTS